MIVPVGLYPPESIAESLRAEDADGADVRIAGSVLTGNGRGFGAVVPLLSPSR